MRAESINAISLSVNEDYVWHAQRLLGSLQRNWPNHPVVLVQHTGLSREAESIFGSFPRVRICHASTSIVGPTINLAVGADDRATYLRLNLWSDNFTEFDRILYLDADTIVLSPLDRLFQMDDFVMFKDHLSNMTGMFADHADQVLEGLLSSDGVDLGGDIANAGVFMIPRRYRNRLNFDEMTALLDRYKTHIRFADQTIINLWMRKHDIKPVDDPRYNFLIRQPHSALHALGLKNIRILHFAGFAAGSPRRKLLMRVAPFLASNRFGRPLYAALQRFVVQVAG
jgi:hypothetical protein